MKKNLIRIESGAQDWRLYQQDSRGQAIIHLKGTWEMDEPYKEARVLVRLVHENNGLPVNRHLNWKPAHMSGKTDWSLQLQVPAGGLYRLETGIQFDGRRTEWLRRGALVHHLGVGDLWLIAGQSNSVGMGRNPVEDGPELGVHMLHADGTWKLATHPLGDSTGSRFPDNMEGWNVNHSPWLTFAKHLKEQLHHPVGLIPTALGGSPLEAWDRKRDGYLFTNMMRYLEAAGGRIRGALWYQGETDAVGGTVQPYLKSFRSVVADLRRVAHAPRLPVITVQLNRNLSLAPEAEAHTWWELIRESQRQAARITQGVQLVTSLDGYLSDTIHNDAHANLKIGLRAARAALAGVYEKPVEWRSPEPRTVKLKGKRVDIVFDHVTEALCYTCNLPELHFFRVRDKQGDIPVKSVTLPKKDALSLELERAPKGTAKVVGGPGSGSAYAIPYDSGTMLPLLGFMLQVKAELRELQSQKAQA